MRSRCAAHIDPICPYRLPWRNGLEGQGYWRQRDATVIRDIVGITVCRLVPTNGHVRNAATRSASEDGRSNLMLIGYPRHACAKPGRDYPRALAIVRFLHCGDGLDDLLN